MRRLLIGLSSFALGGAAAASVALVGEPGRPPAAAAAIQRPIAAPNTRIPVSDAGLRQALAAGLVDRPIKSVLNVPGRMQYGDYRWDDRGVPAGDTWIRVDLNSQILSVFRAGPEIGTAVILYGTDGTPTPTGRFPILAKLKDHRSATYDAPMPYTLRLTNDGLSIHASNVRWGYATHGCVGIPEAFAAKLFASVRRGDEVVIVSGSTNPNKNQA